MQHRAMNLMSKKMAAAQALEGEFSEDGLAAMAGEDNLQMALAKNLAEQIDDADMQRSWSKIKSGPKKVKRPTDGLKALAPPTPEPSPLDALPDEAQLVAQTLLDDQAKQEADEVGRRPWLQSRARQRGTSPGSDEEGSTRLSEEFPNGCTLQDGVNFFEGLRTPSPSLMTGPRPTMTGPRRLMTGPPSPRRSRSPSRPSRSFGWSSPSPEPEDEDDDMPSLTPEILAKMFGNLMGHNLTAEEFFGDDNG